MLKPPINALGGGQVSTVFRSSTVRPITLQTFGMQAVRYPGGEPRPTFKYGTVRNHDYTDPIGGQAMLWKAIETSKGVYNFAGPDRFVNGNAADGSQICWTFVASPDWAVTPAAVGGAAYGGKSNMPPTNNVDWTDHVTAMVTRYSADVKYWQGWNEPNLSIYYAGATATSARLAELQRLLYQTVKAIDPTATVLSPPFTSVFSGVSGLNAFLAASDGAGGTGKDWCDVISYHYYCNPNVDGSKGSNFVSNLYRMHLGVLAAMQTAGISKPIWCTETGCIDPAFTSYTQAEQDRLLRTYMVALLAFGVDRFLWYQIGNALMGFGAAGSVVWDSIADQCIGKSIVYSEVEMDNNAYMRCFIRLSDGSTIEGVYGPMPFP